MKKANVSGYPKATSGGIACIKPVTTHNRFISEFTPGRGMMVIAGNLCSSNNNGNYFSRFVVPPGKNLIYRFPDGFSAHWICVKTNKDCKASMILEYN